MNARTLRFLNTNSLKFLAAALMVVDHVGFIFFPKVELFRIIGRLSMPLFAMSLSEGCRYTRNKLRHFLSIFILAVICQVVYYFFDNGNLYMCILVTFSLAVLTIYALQYCKKCMFDDQVKTGKKLFSCILLALTVAAVYALNTLLTIDYGFWGCMTPVFASLFDFRGIPVPESLKKWDTIPVRAVCLAVGLLCIALSALPRTLPLYALCALPLLLAYNGEKGKANVKYFFYLFYPIHLAVLEGIYLLLYVL